MYIRCVLYTCMLNFLDKLILICLFMSFSVLTKHIFGIKDKNNDMYMFLVYWTYVHMQLASKCLNIMFLYLKEFWTKCIFNSKIQVLENTIFGFWQNFFNTKMVQKVWNLCWNFSHKFVFQCTILKLFLWIFRGFMGIYWIIKTLVFLPRFAAARLGRSIARSTGPGAGRP